MSVTFRTEVTRSPVASSQRMRMSNTIALRTWPTCGMPCTVAPQ